MKVTDLPTLLPSVYGGANEFRRVLIDAVRYATRYPASTSDIRAVLNGALDLMPEAEQGIT